MRAILKVEHAVLPQLVRDALRRERSIEAVQMVDFEEGTHYHAVGNACTTATAAKNGYAKKPSNDSSDDEDWDKSDDDEETD